MGIVSLTDDLLGRLPAGRRGILRDKILCGLCVRIGYRSKTFFVATSHFAPWRDRPIDQLAAPAFAADCAEFGKTRGAALVGLGRGLFGALEPVLRRYVDAATDGALFGSISTVHVAEMAVRFGAPSFMLHDLRKLVATVGERIGVGSSHPRRILNHAPARSDTLYRHYARSRPRISSKRLRPFGRRLRLCVEQLHINLAAAPQIHSAQSTEPSGRRTASVAPVADSVCLAPRALGGGAPLRALNLPL
jgi:hypothetical protein